MRGLPAERPEKGPDIGGQRLRLLQGGKVATPVHGRPALDAEHPLGHQARRTEAAGQGAGRRGWAVLRFAQIYLLTRLQYSLYSWP